MPMSNVIHDLIAKRAGDRRCVKSPHSPFFQAKTVEFTRGAEMKTKNNDTLFFKTQSSFGSRQRSPTSSSGLAVFFKIISVVLPNSLMRMREPP